LTLIELIVVMTMLATVVAVAAPTLSRFFAGRVLENEARRMLALTRYARSEAISRSVLMELWIEPESGTYGLSPQAGYEFDDRKPVEFILADGLVFDVDDESLDAQGEAKILFWPDGSIDGESVEYVRILEDEESAIEIAQADYGLGYVIQSAELGS
jgi:Tfp pilus assembly protein FimT